MTTHMNSQINALLELPPGARPELQVQRIEEIRAATRAAADVERLEARFAAQNSGLSPDVLKRLGLDDGADALQVGDKVNRLVTMRETIAEALGLDRAATRTKILKRIGELVDARGATVAAKQLAEVAFSARVADLFDAEPELDHATAQRRVATADRELFALARG